VVLYIQLSKNYGKKQPGIRDNQLIRNYFGLSLSFAFNQYPWIEVFDRAAVGFAPIMQVGPAHVSNCRHRAEVITSQAEDALAPGFNYIIFIVKIIYRAKSNTFTTINTVITVNTNIILQLREYFPERKALNAAQVK